MFLKNYTSNVPVHQTLHQIEQVLLRCGVTGIAKEYTLDQRVIAVTFKLDTPAGVKAVRLPADAEKAKEVLWHDYIGDDLMPDGNIKWSSRKRQREKDFQKQAEMTAWRIVKDWIEVQMSMIELKQADALQVFLPYLFDGRKTYYQAMKDSNYAGLLGNGGEESNV